LYSCKVLAWRVSNTMDAGFCVDALEEAISRYGAPDIFNTDKGAQFTSDVLTGILKAAGIRISMDGKGRWVDNVFVVCLWCSLKYEEEYLKAYETVAKARLSPGNYFRFYNRQRRHQSLDRQTPDQVCEGRVMWPVAP
jgi:putative transposase